MSKRKEKRLARLKLAGGQYTLNDCQVVAIIYDDAPTLKILAARWGVTQGCVSTIRNGRAPRVATPYFQKHIRRAHKLRRKVNDKAYARTKRIVENKQSRSAMRKADLALLLEDSKRLECSPEAIQKAMRS